MSETASGKNHALKGILLPIAGSKLLLPNAAVVEVLSYPETIEPAEDTPGWYVGCFDWRGLSLPLVSWGCLMGQVVTEDGQRHKGVAICHLFSADHTASFVGLETSGLPSLVSVTEAGLQAQAGSAEPEACILGEVRLQDIRAHIPDLDALGAKLISYNPKRSFINGNG